MKNEKILLVGDNPFQGVSHLSQERERNRSELLNRTEYAANLVELSIDNGAEGFMFSLNESTISIIKTISQNRKEIIMSLYPTVPSAYEYVRLASQSGTIGLMTHVGKQVVKHLDFKAMGFGLYGVAMANPESLLKAYLNYEFSRIKPVTNGNIFLHSLLLHEIVTDMALALNWDWLFQTYFSYVRKLGIKPGFETRNFCYLVKKLRDWNLDPETAVIAAPFNKIGFQMTPTKDECERILATIPGAEVFGFSVLASGYLKLPEAAEYIGNVKELKGIAVGVSSEDQARNTFKFFKSTPSVIT